VELIFQVYFLTEKSPCGSFFSMPWEYVSHSVLSVNSPQKAVNNKLFTFRNRTSSNKFLYENFQSSDLKHQNQLFGNLKLTNVLWQTEELPNQDETSRVYTFLIWPSPTLTPHLHCCLEHWQHSHWSMKNDSTAASCNS
jgi:hypothetical protein